MPKIDETPKNLRPYLFHGLDLQGSPQAMGECPFCYREGKFSVNLESTQWQCFVCQEKGNLTSFLQKLYAEAPLDNQGLISTERKLPEEALQAFGVRLHPITQTDPIIPGYSANRKLSQLYKYSSLNGSSNGHRLVLATPTVHHQLFIPEDYDPKKQAIFVCEGPWDAMALWDALRSYKLTEDDNLVKTGSVAASLYGQYNVIGVPGCGSIGEPFEKWCPLFEDKHVILVFDSDHSRQENGKLIEGAGSAATKRACKILARVAPTPDTISYLKWGPEGFDPARATGFDIRDLLAADPRKGLMELLEKLEPIPEDWINKRQLVPKKKKGSPEIECLPCSDWKTLIMAWRKAFKWTEGLDKALSVMLASVSSTKAVGDQLWVKIIGPAACGKSSLCEALSVNKKYVTAKSTIRGFHSGFKSDGAGKEDNSLLVTLKDKTLITKDGDTLLQSPNLGQILSEARDIYDRVSRTHYRNKMGKDYEGLNLTWILCGTSSLRSIDSSELGERFLDCVIMDDIDPELEDEILWKVINRADHSMAYETDGRKESQHEPEMLKAMQLTGGYVSYLRQNAQELLTALHIDDQAKMKVLHLGKFVAYMRARPSQHQDEKAEREFASRLVSQLWRLAKCLAIVTNKKTIDQEVLDRTRAVALDTARGKTLEIAKHLYDSGRKGLFVATLAGLTGDTDVKQRELLKFLRKIKATEIYTVTSSQGVKSRPRWRLTERLHALFTEIYEAQAAQKLI